MTSTTIVKVTTKLNKNEEKGRETQLTIDWDCTEEQLRELAKRAVVVQYQSILRASGSIPAEDTLKVSSLFVRTPRVAKKLTTDDILAQARANPEMMEELKKALGIK